MIVIIIVMIILFAMHNALQGTQGPLRRQQREKKYVLEVCILFILLAALRYVIPGSDASGFKGDYNGMMLLTFREVFEEKSISYVYFLLSKVFSLTRLPYHFWFGFIELLYVSAFVRMINKFSVDKMMCLFLFYIVGLYSFSFHGLKQILAMTLIWHGFMDIYEKKYLRSAILVFLAYFCHKTSMVFLLAYIMPFLGNFRRIYYILIVGIVTILVFSYTSVLTQLTDIMGDEHYASYLESTEGYSSSVLFFYFVLFGMAFFSKRQKNETSDTRIIVGLAVITILSQLFAFRVASAFRLSLYFLPFLIIYISNQLENKKVLQYLVFLFGAVWLLYTSRFFPYKFFWQ